MWILGLSFRSDDIYKRWKYIDKTCYLLQFPSSLLETLLPIDACNSSQTTFPFVELVASQRTIHAIGLHVGHSAIVAHKEDNGIIPLSRLTNGIQDSSNTGVHT